MIPTTSKGAARSLAAERMRRYRERRRERLRCLMIEIREREIDALVGLGLLKTEMRKDASAIVAALYTLSTAHWVQ